MIEYQKNVKSSKKTFNDKKMDIDFNFQYRKLFQFVFIQNGEL
jgi:hypothetical protein